MLKYMLVHLLSTADSSVKLHNSVHAGTRNTVCSLLSACQIYFLVGFRPVASTCADYYQLIVMNDGFSAPIYLEINLGSPIHKPSLYSYTTPVLCDAPVTRLLSMSRSIEPFRRLLDA